MIGSKHKIRCTHLQFEILFICSSESESKLENFARNQEDSLATHILWSIYYIVSTYNHYVSGLYMVTFDFHQISLDLFFIKRSFGHHCAKFVLGDFLYCPLNVFLRPLGHLLLLGTKGLKSGFCASDARGLREISGFF